MPSSLYKELTSHDLFLHVSFVHDLYIHLISLLSQPKQQQQQQKKTHLLDFHFNKLK